MKIVDHRLKGEGVQFSESPNHSGALTPDSIIIHYTAGSDFASSLKHLTNPERKASAHLLVGRDGEIAQLVPFNVIAWHAGISQYKGRSGYNKYSIGIEIDNAGFLTRNGDRYTSWFGRDYKENEVVFARHRNESAPRYWHRFTEKQITLVQEICELLKTSYGIVEILGHEEISPDRKTDPGPAFPLDKMRERVLGAGRDLDSPAIPGLASEGLVTANALNFRAHPSTGAEKIARPLPKGKRVQIVSSSPGWYKVRASIEGWVSSKFVHPLD